jgi:hypothetical protein
LDFHLVPAKRPAVKIKALPVVVTLGLLGLAVAVVAQIEGGDRGVAPIDTSGSFEVTGIDVDVAAQTAEAARLGAWRIAQRKAWALLWAKTHGGRGGAPTLSDSQLDGIVSAVVVDDEQIGPKRYVARLGVLFDRARAGQILGVSGQVSRSAPMLVLPVEWSGGTPRSFEAKTDWQKAWARFRAGASPIDYVRPVGTGADPLLLTVGQTQRPAKRWWRGLLDQYGAADVLIPVVELTRLWPGGPVVGKFSARHGPYNELIETFTLRAATSDALPSMLDEGVKRIDQIYAQALANGALAPDPSLIIEVPVVPALPANNTTEAAVDTPRDNETNVEPVAPVTTVSTYTVQFDTPDVGSVTATESAMKGIPGVRSADTSSLALGGTSVMRVSFAGEIATLRLALQARGYRVDEGGGVLRIRRNSSAP